MLAKLVKEWTFNQEITSSNPSNLNFLAFSDFQNNISWPTFPCQLAIINSLCKKISVLFSAISPPTFSISKSKELKLTSLPFEHSTNEQRYSRSNNRPQPSCTVGLLQRRAGHLDSIRHRRQSVEYVNKLGLSSLSFLILNSICNFFYL